MTEHSFKPLIWAFFTVKNLGGWGKLKKILIVDDALFMRATIKMLLEKNGFEVAGEAENGAVAVEKYKTLKPDLVVMDITMPEMTGTEALKLIKEYDPKAKVVMISAMGQESMVKEAVMLGASSFIIKPFQQERVIQTLRQLLP